VQKYELVVVLDPTLSEEDQKGRTESIEQLIVKNGGPIDAWDVWGTRRMAYPIGRRREGFYAVLLFDCEPNSEVLPELNRYLRITEGVMRSLVTTAIVGKSRGNPALAEEYQRNFGRMPGGRGPRGPRRDDFDRGRDRDDRRPPREDAPREREDAPKESASEGESDADKAGDSDS